MDKYLFRDGEEIKTLIKGTPGANIVSIMSSNTSPDPIVISTTNNFVDAWKWFDGSSVMTTPGTRAIDILIDLGQGRKARLDRVVILTNSSVKKPRDMDIYGSNDGSSFDLLYQHSDASRTNTDISIDLVLKGQYRFYRINIKSIVDSYWKLEMNEINLIGEYESEWEVFPDSALSEELFNTKGMSDLSIVSSDDLGKFSSNQLEVLSLVTVENTIRTLSLECIPSASLAVLVDDVELNEYRSISIDSNKVGSNAVIIVAVSGDGGNTWEGKHPIQMYDLVSIKENGFTPEELNVLTKEQIATLFPNGTARFAFYLEQENLTDVVEIQSIAVGEKQYTISPTATDLSLIYEILQEEKPTLYASRDDGVSWKEISQDEMASLSEQPEGSSLRVKAVLKNGQEIHAMSYAWA